MNDAPLLLAVVLALAACGAQGQGGGGLDRAAAGSGSETVTPASPLPASLKGYELYAWDDAGEIRFTLITGTNRPKTMTELMLQDNSVEDGAWVILNRAGLDNLKRMLERVPEGTPVVFAQHPELPGLSGPHRVRIEELLATAGF